jgi:hypothetical protein
MGTPPLSHNHNFTRRDNPAYEHAAATTPAPSPSSFQRSPAQEAAQMLRLVLSLIADACLSPLDAYYCVLRASGLSMTAIARRDGHKSRQAVHKRLRKICRREPVLLEYLCHDRRQNAHMNATTNQPPTTDQPDKEPTDA